MDDNAEQSEQSEVGNTSDDSDSSDADEQDAYELPYDEIIETWGRIKEPIFPNVPVGMRNTTLFTICNGLRYICEHNERKLQSLI